MWASQQIFADAANILLFINTLGARIIDQKIKVIEITVLHSHLLGEIDKINRLEHISQCTF